MKRHLKISSQFQHVFCTRCKKYGLAETLCNVSILLWTQQVQTLRCEHCGGGWESLRLTEKGAAGNPGESVEAPDVPATPEVPSAGVQ